MTTYTTLRAIADKMDCRQQGSLADEIDNILDVARINADDTIYVDKSVPETDWDVIATASIQDVLSQSATSSRAIKWFARHGLTF